MAGALQALGEDGPDLKSKVDEIATEVSQFKMDLKRDIVAFVRREMRSGRLGGMDEARIT